MRTNADRALLAGIVLVIATSSGCGGVESDWEKASRENSSAAYERFLAAHPASVHEQEAKAAAENAAWIELTKSPAPAAFQAFAARYPGHRSAEDGVAITLTPEWVGSATAPASGAPKLHLSLNADEMPFRTNLVRGITRMVATTEQEVSGTLTSSLGSRTEVASFKKLVHIYDGTSRDDAAVAGQAFCLGSGKVILPMSAFEGDPDGFELAGPRFRAERIDVANLIITIADDRNELLCFQNDGVGDDGVARSQYSFVGIAIDTPVARLVRSQKGWVAYLHPVSPAQ